MRLLKEEEHEALLKVAEEALALIATYSDPTMRSRGAAINRLALALQKVYPNLDLPE